MPGSVISADGSRIGWESCGDGPPMLLVHGTSATLARWAPVRNTLAERYAVYAMDRRGRGLSAAEANPYHLRREAEDIAAVAEAIGGDVYVVAHSYGALCTIEAALLTSAFRRILLYEPPSSTPGLHGVAPATVELLKRTTDLEAILETFYLEALQLPRPAVDELKHTEMWRIRLTAAPTIARELDQVNGYGATDRLGAITAPVRMLLGTESPAPLRASTAALASQIADARIVALQGQAHQAIDLDTDQFVQLVLEFENRR